ncbi:MAG: hypothetical protein AUI14_04850 [Actinobacteria bacterium 13_2_20CM_2_71_6]|nr:MAG: hypothetical protein AUI14_04850 [Actinobacteria bacterium 13_2_20CM_2_71_6]
MRGGNGTALEAGNGRALHRADRLYARLLWLLPGDLRREYGAAMRQTFADLCAARVDARGRGLTPVLAHGLADLVGGAVSEWTVTLFARDRWHRSAATGLCAVAGLLVLYSQVRYPANLPRIDYLAQYLLLLAILAALAHGFAGRATVSARTVCCALATLPGWLAGMRFPLVGFGYVAALILAGAVGAARRDGQRYAGVRAGVAGGVLAGVTVLAVNVTIGGAVLMFACVAAGALLGLAASAGTAVAAHATRRSLHP